MTAARRAKSSLVVASLIAVSAATWFVSQRFGRPPAVDVVGTVITGFRKENALTVFSAQVVTVNTRVEPRAFGLLESRQTAIIPASVEYRLDQSTLTPDRFRWDAQARAMTLTLPGLTITRPNLDEARAQYFRSGVPVTGAMRDALARAATAGAEREAVRQASGPHMQALARAAAREAMTRNLLVPLQAAGFDKARVTVRFADEPGGADPSFLDPSRPVEEVLRERARSRTTPATTPSS